VTRRQLLFLPVATLPVAAYARFVEPEWLEIARETVPLPNFKSGERVRIVHLSDLHASDAVSRNLIESAVEIALSQKPDIICVTGDFITAGKGVDWAWYPGALRRLSAHVPTYGVLGNHDGGASTMYEGRGYSTARVRKLLRDSGIRELHNENTEITIRKQTLRLVGCAEMWAGECLPDIAFRDVPADRMPTVLLSHNPDSKTKIAGYHWDLMLAGHTHGGQVVLPFVGLSPAPVSDQNYVKGLKPWRDRLIYVTAGVGNIAGIRFNCRPQVSVLDLGPEPSLSIS
jgi:hypothetical protein